MDFNCLVVIIGVILLALAVAIPLSGVQMEVPTKKKVYNLQGEVIGYVEYGGTKTLIGCLFDFALILGSALTVVGAVSYWFPKDDC